MKYKFKCIIITLLLLISSIHYNVFAKVVTIDQATAVAETFWSQQDTRSSNGSILFSWDDSDISIATRSTSTHDRLFYVFESYNSQGFVIISAEDNVMPILGYSFTDTAPNPSNIPQPMHDWLQVVAEQINYIRNNDVINVSHQQMWERFSAGNIVLELETAKWNQSKPYNDQCPYDGDRRSLVGCVPTAVAIVMRYHKWPQYGIGMTESYYTETKGIYVESRDLNHAYNWNQMPLIYTSNSYSDAEANAVSMLMADIGASFQADYTNDETPCILNTKALYEYFDYNPAMFDAERKNYSDNIWLQMLKDEINGLRPILYSGFNDNSGHQFIIDGYTDDNYFHINWGWGGVANGYYTLSSLVPDDRGGYNNDQWACINLKPNTSSEVENWITFQSPGIVMSETNFEQNIRFYFDELYFCNRTAIDFSGIFRGAITDRDGNIKSWITNDLEYTLPSWYMVGFKNVSATITQPICIGDRIRFFYKLEYSDTWNLIKSMNQIDCLWEILVADEYDISETTSFTYDRNNGVIRLIVKDGVSAQLYSSTNKDVTDMLIIDGNFILINTKNLSSDTYVMKLQKGSDEKIIEFAIK